MQIWIDNEMSPLIANPDETLKEATISVSTEINGPRRRVVRVVIDGEDITGRFEHEIYSRKTSELNRLEVFTGDPFVLALDAVPMVKDFLIGMKTEINSATEWFRFGRIQEAGGSMARIADGLMLLTHSIEQMRSLLKLDLAELVYNDVSVLDHYTKLGEMIDELVSAQGETDWILVADLLEYELLPIIDDWAGILALIENKGVEIINAVPVV